MTMNNPKQVNVAVYFVDERNEWCRECHDRLSPDETMGETMILNAGIRNCTECESFAAGTHLGLRMMKRLTHDAVTKAIELTEAEQEAILYAIGVAVEETTNYLERCDAKVDYGKEFPAFCDANVKRYTLLAGVCGRLERDDKAKSCLEMATYFEEARDDETEEAGS